MAHMGAVLMVGSSNKHLRIGMQYRTRGFHHYNLRVFIHFFRNIPLKIKNIKCLGFVLIQRINYFGRKNIFSPTCHVVSAFMALICQKYSYSILGRRSINQTKNMVNT